MTYELTDSDLAEIEEWLQALRSGKYKQGSRYLRPTTDTWCCLGVYIDAVLKKVVATGDDTFSSLSECDLRPAWMSVEIEDYLIDMNDRLCKTFDEIADFIEVAAAEGELHGM